VRKRIKVLAARRRALGGVALLAIVAGGAVLALSGGSGSNPISAAAGTATGSGAVERRTLAERLTVGGTIGYAGDSTVLARLSGTLTALPKVGDTVERGEQLYALSGAPVLLMYGEVPAYRELAEGVEEGVDVLQLEQNLAALGYEPGTVDEAFSSSTAAAVSAWQEDLGLEATGAVELGRVTFLPGPRRVTEVEATLGEAIGSGGGGGLTADTAGPGATTLVAYEPPALEDGVESPPDEAAEPDPKGEPEAEKPEEAEPQDRAPRSESPAASPSQAEASPESGGEGESSDPASVPILKTSSTQRIVSVELDPDQQSVAHRGQRVEVLLPADEQARGRVRMIVATEGSSEEAPGAEAEPGVEVRISIIGKARAPALDGAAVSVLFTQGLRRDVLSVPLTALVAVGNDHFAVVAIEGAQRRRIEVAPGLAADGYVEVEGKGLREGMRVETGE
jgi:peptidoglycan hydrolase-like protein with peptidoglycan-binding domain